MGTVFKARQINLDRLVALKVIRTRPLNDEKFSDRFLREARTLARMKYSRIVTIYDYGDSNGTLFILMELIEGQDLKRRLADGPLEPRPAIELAVQVCKALEYAHRQGVVHRDLKPANILLDPLRGAILVDFGLAKILNRETSDLNLTSTFVVLGTPNYMAPEQFTDPKAVDHRTDIYALGVVLYEMLTLRRPDTVYEPVADRLGLHSGIDSILQRALRSDPEERLSSVSEFRSLIELYARDHLHAPTTTAAIPPERMLSHKPIFIRSRHEIGRALFRVPTPGQPLGCDSVGSRRSGWQSC